MARCSLQGLSSFNGEYPVETRKTPLPDRLTATRVCFVDFLALGSYSDSLQGEGETGKPGGQGVRQWTQTNNTPRYRRVFSEKGGWIARVCMCISMIEQLSFLTSVCLWIYSTCSHEAEGRFPHTRVYTGGLSWSPCPIDHWCPRAFDRGSRSVDRG